MIVPVKMTCDTFRALHGKPFSPHVSIDVFRLLVNRRHFPPRHGRSQRFPMKDFLARE